MEFPLACLPVHTISSIISQCPCRLANHPKYSGQDILPHYMHQGPCCSSKTWETLISNHDVAFLGVVLDVISGTTLRAYYKLVL